MSDGIMWNRAGALRYQPKPPRSRTTIDDSEVCTRCKVERRRSEDQRFCKKCHAANEKARRARAKAGKS